MVALFGVSQQLFARIVFDHPLAMSPARAWAIAVYSLFARSSLLILRYRVGPEPRAAIFMPFISSPVDFGFLVLQGWFSQRLDHVVWPEMSAVAIGDRHRDCAH